MSAALILTGLPISGLNETTVSKAAAEGTVRWDNPTNGERAVAAGDETTFLGSMTDTDIAIDVVFRYHEGGYSTTNKANALFTMSDGGSNVLTVWHSPSYLNGAAATCYAGAKTDTGLRFSQNSEAQDTLWHKITMVFKRKESGYTYYAYFDGGDTLAVGSWDIVSKYEEPVKGLLTQQWTTSKLFFGKPASGVTYTIQDYLAEEFDGDIKYVQIRKLGTVDAGTILSGHSAVTTEARAEYDAAVKSCESLKENEYTKASWAPLKEALTNTPETDWAAYNAAEAIKKAKEALVPFVALQGVSIRSEEGDITLGGTDLDGHYLEAVIQPAEASDVTYKWESSDENLRLTPVQGGKKANLVLSENAKPGKYDIEVTVTAKDSAGSEKKDSFTVHVNIPYHFETGVVIGCEDMGTVTSDKEDGMVYCGDSITLTATPEPGYYFDQWYADWDGTEQLSTGSGNAETLTITLAESDPDVLAAYAKFIRHTYSVTAGIVGNAGGKVEVDPQAAIVDWGGSATVTATPDDGWQVEGWYSDQDGSAPLVNGGGVQIAGDLSSCTFSDIKEGKRAYVKFKNMSAPAGPAVKVGDKKKIGKFVYVVKTASSSKTVAVVGPANKSSKSLTIPPTVKIDGVSYKVVEVKAKAFAKCKKLTQVKIGANVTVIGAKAFSGSAKLKKITIKSKALKKISKQAFAKINKKAKIKVPKKKFKAYKNMLKRAKTIKSAKITK